MNKLWIPPLVSLLSVIAGIWFSHMGFHALALTMHVLLNFFLLIWVVFDTIALNRWAPKPVNPEPVTPEPVTPKSPFDGSPRADKYHAAFEAGQAVIAARKAAHQQQLEAARPAVEKWLQDYLPAAIQAAITQGSCRVKLLKVYPDDVDFMGLSALFRINGSISASQFLSVEGQVLIETLLQDGFTVQVEFSTYSRTVRNFKDLEEYLSGYGYPNIYVSWPALKSA